MSKIFLISGFHRFSARMNAHVDTSLLKVSQNIEENGGKIVDLNNPKLTHVVIDKRDMSRRIILMQLASE